ncbi:Z1 domain-containing protein [Timonella sp. A28]|uniref:Z1 domain-containing protein n=1 Tax=Timonella sp. A28 TaxID=3442640 RepID=UPI003EB94A1F
MSVNQKTLILSEENEHSAVVWQPAESLHLNNLMEKAQLTSVDRVRVITETNRIVSRCVEPVWGTERSNVSLVLGRVQSGKTLSFTAVCTAAIDNGYPLIVILAGTKNNLFNQTFTRLQKDLGEAFGDTAPVIYANPTKKDESSILDKILPFQSPNDGLFKRKANILVVLKHKRRIREAASLLACLKDQTDISFPILLIDDEADQAGLNTLHSQGQQSSVNAAISLLRESMSLHTYLMYTATPEAPLLLAAVDSLAPESVTVLEAGAGYTGGEKLFSKDSNSFINIIPKDEIELAFDPTIITPPPSLTNALNYYLMVLCYGAHLVDQVKATMLIHPSGTIDHHERFHAWVLAYLEELKSTLGEDESYRTSVLIEQFQEGYNELKVRVEDPVFLKPLKVYLASLREVVMNILSKVVNSNSDDEITSQDWSNYHGVIVTGGNVLDRGFTVENLAVTYMPRGKGVGNADSIQQRGRFFGYRGRLTPFLRGWFPLETANAFSAYVDHERIIRKDLLELDAQNQKLIVWKRQFFMKHALVPTRSAVISANVVKLSMERNIWQFRQHKLLSSSESNDLHTQTISNLFKCSVPHELDNRNNISSRHRVSTVRLGEVLPMLSEWHAEAEESVFLSNVLFVVSSFIDQDGEVDLLDVDGWFSRTNTAIRQRSIISNQGTISSQINNLHQGRSNSAGVFPGDAAFRSSDRLTIQFHRVSGKKNGVALPAITAICISLPDEIHGKVFSTL